MLNEREMRKLFHKHNDVLNAGCDNGHTNPCECKLGACVFVDNVVVAHRTSPNAHKSPDEQGLRILHRITIKLPRVFEAPAGLPQFLNVCGPSPGEGVWVAALDFDGTTAFKCKTHTLGVCGFCEAVMTFQQDCLDPPSARRIHQIAVVVSFIRFHRSLWI